MATSTCSLALAVVPAVVEVVPTTVVELDGSLD
jgi:hypothetical protein